MTRAPKIAALAVAAVLLSAPPAAAEVTLINLFEVPPGGEAEVIAAWERARDFLSGEPGYISTRLHRALAPDAPYALVNVARWESAEAFRAAAARLQAAGVFPEMAGVRYTPGLFEVLRDDSR